MYFSVGSLYFNRKVYRSNLLSVSMRRSIGKQNQVSTTVNMVLYDQQHYMGCQFMWLILCLTLISLSDAFRYLLGFKEQVEKMWRKLALGQVAPGPPIMKGGRLFCSTEICFPIMPFPVYLIGSRVWEQMKLWSDQFYMSFCSYLSSRDTGV